MHNRAPARKAKKLEHDYEREHEQEKWSVTNAALLRFRVAQSGRAH